MRNVTLVAIAATIILALETILYWIPSERTLDSLAYPFLTMLFVYGVPIACGLNIYQGLRLNSDHHTRSIPWITVSLTAGILTSYALFMYWLFTFD